MKIKYPKEHDSIVYSITRNSKNFFEHAGVTENYTKLSYKRQCELFNRGKLIGIVDVMFKLENEDISSYEHDEKGNRLFKFIDIFVIVNVKLESASDQLREIKKLKKEYFDMNSLNSISDLTYFIIVSENDQFESFFTDEHIFFYKFDKSSFE